MAWARWPVGHALCTLSIWVIYPNRGAQMLLHIGLKVRTKWVAITIGKIVCACECESIRERMRDRRKYRI